MSTAARKGFSLGCLLTSNRCCACRKEGFFKLLETEREKLGAARRQEVAALEAKHTELRTDHEALTATNEELRAQQAKDKARRIAILAEQAVSLYCHLCCQVLPRVRERRPSLRTGGAQAAEGAARGDIGRPPRDGDRGAAHGGGGAARRAGGQGGGGGGPVPPGADRLGLRAAPRKQRTAS